MAGRGKGGKGLGKGPRFYRPREDQLKSLARPQLLRIARRAGVKSMSGQVSTELRGIVGIQVEKIIELACNNALHRRAKTINLQDMEAAIEQVSGENFYYSPQYNPGRC